MIVNIGVAGTLTKDLNVLDVAVATNVLQHDMDTSPIGDPKGLLSGINMILLPADTKMVELMCSCLADRNIHYKKGCFGLFVRDDRPQRIGTEVILQAPVRWDGE